jgi:hypothetical protein
MHPVVIMTYDKSPAINKAVTALEEAGLEVRVLNTATSKLADFLGALAGVDDEEEIDEPKPDDENLDADVEADLKAAPKEPKEEQKPDEELPEQRTHAVSLNGERVLVEIVKGSDLVLFPSEIVIGAKTHYTLNESKFSFWPAAVSNEPVRGAVDLHVEGEPSMFINVVFSEQTMSPPVLRVGRDLLEDALSALKLK